MALDGTIDFMCWPNFDSPTVFAALLDPERGGCFELAPALEEARSAQLYLPDRDVLTTRWLSETGSAELIDLTPFPTSHGAQRMLIRRTRATRGRASIRLRCHPQFDYARAKLIVRRARTVSTSPPRVRSAFASPRVFRSRRSTVGSMRTSR